MDLIINLVYIGAAISFVLGLKLMSKPSTARAGNLISALGMLAAVVMTMFSKGILDYKWIALGLAVGTVIGIFAARLVAMTKMPEMVALFNGFGGIASLLVGWSVFHLSLGAGVPHLDTMQMVTIVLSVIIGGVTFTGSLIAFLKLSELIPGRPVLFPGQYIVNTILLAGMAGAGVWFGLEIAGIIPVIAMLPAGYFPFLIIVGLSFVYGVLFVIPIGGADMPVVISLLNSFSGLAACAAGFVIQNNILIVSGALVGASGIILTNIMCKAMNRSITNVLFSGFGSGAGSVAHGKATEGTVQPITVEDAYLILEAAGSVVFVPGYGLAVAQAQHVTRELGELLEKNGAEVSYAIHPVAGRMPGHMNVLLAEANVPYDQLVEMDEINSRISTVDVCIVVGANDVVNPSAHEDETSPIYGMPIINAEQARTVFVLKRSMATGFAGVTNPLFFRKNTRMLFGDAKATIQGLVSEFKGS